LFNAPCGAVNKYIVRKGTRRVFATGENPGLNNFQQKIMKASPANKTRRRRRDGAEPGPKKISPEIYLRTSPI